MNKKEINIKEMHYYIATGYNYVILLLLFIKFTMIIRARILNDHKNS